MDTSPDFLQIREMPYSSSIFDQSVLSLLAVLRPSTCLDIGAGAGKYGHLMRQSGLNIRATALEIERDYISRFSLDGVYDSIMNMAAEDLLNPRFYDIAYDLVILGDVLEHLRKSDGVDLLSFLVYRCKWILVQFPSEYRQNSVDGYHREAHISVWSERDFDSFDRSPMTRRERQNLVLIRGYIEDATALADLTPFLEITADCHESRCRDHGA